MLRRFAREAHAHRHPDQPSRTAVGSLISELEARPDTATVELGLLLLKMGEQPVKTVNEAIEDFKAFPGKASTRRDVTIGLGGISSGLTVHWSDQADREAADRLIAHCEARKYSQRAASWFGILIRPANELVRLCLKLELPWEQDAQMDQNLLNFGEPRSLKEARSDLHARKKVGRNGPCPCGSGLKYKKCCLR